MLAVLGNDRQLAPLLEVGCEVAAVNGPGQTVLSGPPGAIDAAERRARAVGLSVARLPTARAFHSAAMQPAADALLEQMQHLPLATPRIPFTSNLSGSWIGSEARDPKYWARQLRSTVRFGDQLECLLGQPDAVLVELSPQPQLAALARRHPAYQGQPILCVADPPQRGGLTPRSLLRLVGELWALDVPCRVTGPSTSRTVVTLPAYPFQRTRKWVDAPDAEPPNVPRGGAQETEHASLSTVQADRSADSASTVGRLQAIFRRLIGDGEVGPRDDFFAVGGTSLLATQLMNEIERELGVVISIRDFYEDPTLHALATRVDEQLSIAPGERERLEL